MTQTAVSPAPIVMPTRARKVSDLDAARRSRTCRARTHPSGGRITAAAIATKARSRSPMVRLPIDRTAKLFRVTIARPSSTRSCCVSLQHCTPTSAGEVLRRFAERFLAPVSGASQRLILAKSLITVGIVGALGLSGAASANAAEPTTNPVPNSQCSGDGTDIAVSGVNDVYLPGTFRAYGDGGAVLQISAGQTSTVNAFKAYAAFAAAEAEAAASE